MRHYEKCSTGINTGVNVDINAGINTTHLPAKSYGALDCRGSGSEAKMQVFGDGSNNTKDAGSSRFWLLRIPYNAYYAVVSVVIIASFISTRELWLMYSHNNDILWAPFLHSQGHGEFGSGGFSGLENLKNIGLIDSTSYKQYLDTVTFENASAIFNTVSNTLSQKGSDLLPNGMSIIPAVIPAGTYMWHGCSGEFPSSPEWLAMDPEFSYSFSSALPHVGRRRQHGPPPGAPDDPDKGGPPNGPPGMGPPNGHPNGPPGMDPPNGPPNGPPGKGHADGPPGSPPGANGFPNGPPDSPPGGPPEMSDAGSNKAWRHGGVLLTFRAKQDLSKILILDGASASKADNGQSDTQILLARLNSSGGDFFRNEYEAAARICDWGKSFGLDGVVRLETAFELILCDFHSPKIELVSNVTYGEMNDITNIDFPDYSDVDNHTIAENGLLYDTAKQLTTMALYEQLQLVSFHSYDEPRLLPDYSGMVTAINRSYVSPDTYTRRLSNFSEEVKEQMISEVETFFRGSKGADPYSGTNWRDQTRLFSTKFGPVLLVLNSSYTGYTSGETSLRAAATNATVFTFNTIRRFYDYGISDVTERKAKAKQSFVFEYAHPTGVGLRSQTDRLIWSSLATVAARVWDELEYQYEFSVGILGQMAKDADSFKEAEYKEDLSKHSDSVRTLLDELQWYPLYYQCPRTCSWNEVCYTPVWGPGPRPASLGGTFGGIGADRISADQVQCVGVFDMLW